MWENLILKRAKKIYFPTVCMVPTYLRENISFRKGGRGRICFFLEIYTPGLNKKKVDKYIAYTKTCLGVLRRRPYPPAGARSGPRHGSWNILIIKIYWDKLKANGTCGNSEHFQRASQQFVFTSEFCVFHSNILLRTFPHTLKKTWGILSKEYV